MKKNEIQIETNELECKRRIIEMLPSSETIEANGIEGGLRDGELQMFWEGANWLKNYLKRELGISED